MVFLNKKTHRPTKSNVFDNAIRKRIDIMTAEENEKREKEGLKPIEPHYLSAHDFRHTFATRFLEAAKRENYAKVYKYLSRTLGHSSVKITLDLYSHLTKKQKMKLWMTLMSSGME